MSENTDITSLIHAGGDKEKASPELAEQVMEVTLGHAVEYFCDALDDENINDIVEEVSPEVVFLIGFPDYGRSTFVGSVYHILLTEGMIGDYKFYDSNTYVGFERRLYLRNAKNTKYNIAPTKRTVRGEKYFLDFILKNDDDEKIHIVLADRAGEDFKFFSSKGFPSKGFESIKHASRFAFFLDARQITGLSSDTVVDMFCQMAYRMKQDCIFHDGLTVDVLFNKIDTVSDEDKDVLDKNRDIIVSKIKEASGIGDVKTFEVSSLFDSNTDGLRAYLSYLVGSVATKRKEMVYNPELVNWVKQKIGGEHE